MMKRDNAAKPIIASVRLVDSGFSNVNYAGWSGDLLAWELDAKDMAAIAHAAGMTSTLLLTKESTRKNVLASVRAASGALQSGDLLFVSYSGHGGQITDVSGEVDDKLDETWSLYEGELIDDKVFLELRALPRACGCWSSPIVATAAGE